MRTLSDLANELEAAAAEMPPRRANELSIKCAETILFDLLVNTPVDTGQGVSNWIVALDEPSRDQIEAYVQGKKGSTAQLCQEAAFAAALEVLSHKQPGQTIYISNNLPYIRMLDSGTSTQAPAGFVERASLLGRLFVENPQDFADG